jgi:hypothetical protein
MRSLHGVVLAAALGAALLGGCMEPPKVAQGTVVSFDPAKHIMVVRDDRPPRAELRFSVESAEIGARPAVGDIVRLAYHEAAGGSPSRATRVTNISRQAELRGN